MAHPGELAEVVPASQADGAPATVDGAQPRHDETSRLNAHPRADDPLLEALRLRNRLRQRYFLFDSSLVLHRFDEGVRQ